MITWKHKRLITYLKLIQVEDKNSPFHVMDVDVVCEEYSGSLYETIFYILNRCTLPISKLEDLEYMNALIIEYDDLLYECSKILNDLFKNYVDRLE